jgi:hypothetical protein
VIYSKYHHQVWFVGDCQCRVDGETIRNPNGVDEFIAGVRCMINQSEVLQGKSIEWLLENDPGSEFIKPLLSEQFRFQNHGSSRAGALSYTAFDGRKIHACNVKLVSLKKDASEIILASDGYPVLFDTLAECEASLNDLLMKDPLCIYENRGVKGVYRGQISFDDRAFIKLDLH